MKLQKVIAEPNTSSSKYLFTCIRCGKQTQKACANLEGKAFVEYYCQDCVNKLPVLPEIETV